MKKKLLFVLSMVLVAVLSVIGTLAYLTSEDSDVNVMTMGNVKIEQLEYERVVDENGDWVSTGETDTYGYIPDKLQEFTQAKPLYPAVFADGNIKWDDRVNGHQQSWGSQIDGASGSNTLFDDSVKNVQDKFVFVKNTGKSDAYVRTWIAFEQGSIDSNRYLKEVVEQNMNVNGADGNKGHWEKDYEQFDVEIDGNTYYVVSLRYRGPHSNPNGILAPGKVSYPSLLQVYMKPTATNEDVEAVDGNGNGLYDILVLSQAVQTNGFADAKTALNEAFGTNHPWVDAKMSTPVVENGVMNLTGDIYVVDKPFYNEVDNTSPVTINGNGNTVHQTITSEDLFTWSDGGTRPAMGNLFFSPNGSKITVNDITFKGTTHTNLLSKWDSSNANNEGYNVELNNVNIVGVEVLPAWEDSTTKLAAGVLVYGKATINNSNIYDTRLSKYEYDPKFTAYDIAIQNSSSVYLNGGKVGKIIVWENAQLVVDGNAKVDTIYATRNSKADFKIEIKSGSVVNTLDLSKVKDSSKSQVVVEDGATIGKVVVNGTEMTFEEWLNK